MNVAVIIVFVGAVAGYVIYKQGYWPSIVETAKAAYSKIKNK